MSSTDPILAVAVLLVVVGVLFAPLVFLKMRSRTRGGERPVFHVMGTLRERMIGSMIPTHRFDVFSDGLLVSSIFSERYISAKEIKTVTRTRFQMKSYIELKLKSGESLYLATTRNKKLLDQLVKLFSETAG